MSDLRDLLAELKPYVGVEWVYVSKQKMLAKIDAALSAQPQPEAVEAVKPPVSAHWLGDREAASNTKHAVDERGCVLYFTDQANCIAFMQMLTVGLAHTAPPFAPDERMREADPLDDLVARFSTALLKKLKLARANGRGGWEKDDWEAGCQRGLLRHVEKGDPRDVAAYCAFMWHHGWATSLSGAADASNAGAEARLLAERVKLVEMNKCEFGGEGQAIIRWERIDAIDHELATLSPDADEGTKSEGGVEGHAIPRTTSATTTRYPVTGGEEHMVAPARRTEGDASTKTGQAGIKSGPSDPTPAEQREAIAQWPDGCRNPNSCSIHRDCMYVGCTNYDRDISGEVDAALLREGE